MAYKKTNWQDHVVERPRNYTQVENPDGSKTFTPSPGEVIQQGTPQSATNFNNMEDGTLHNSVAIDMLVNLVTGLEMEVNELKEKLEALVSAGGE